MSLLVLAANLVSSRPLGVGEAILTHYPPPGTEPVHIGTLEVMTAVLFDFGVFLLVFGFAVGVASFFARAIAGKEGPVASEGGGGR